MYILETGCVDRLCRMSHLRQHVCVEYVGCPVNCIRIRYLSQLYVQADD